MKRGLKNNEVERIKEMLAKGYKNSSIKETFRIKYDIEVSTSTLSAIKKGEQYREVRHDLNEKIFAQYDMKLSREKREIIEGVKFALANGYNKDEILRTYGIAEKYFQGIKWLYAPYYNVAPEYNNAILSMRERNKKANIDSKMICGIKETYISHNGNISLSDIADMFDINSGTVSYVLNLKIYRNYGKKFNSRLREMKKEKENLIKQKREKEERKTQIRKRIKELQEKEKEIKSQIGNTRRELNAAIAS